MTTYPEDVEFTFDDYQHAAGHTAIYPEAGESTFRAINYTIVGVGNEAGEALGKWKKFLRDDSDDFPDDERRAQILDELGDVLWYVANACSELGENMEMVAKWNLDKLAGRKERGTIGGSGDVR